PAATPEQQGLRLLDQARIEITKGNTATARKLAEKALEGPFGGPVQAQAEFVLRSIDAEEFNQQRNQANRSFEAAISAFNRSDAMQARAILNAIDVHLLDQEKQTKYKELMRTPQMQPSSAVAQASGRGDGAGVAKATDDPAAPKALPVEVNLAQKV